MEDLTAKIRRFLYSGSGSGDGDGSGSGYGSGDGDGSGSGDGYGDGYGSGDGDGSGSGDGYGDGHGYGSGHGSGDGDGSGHGSGDGDGSGHGSGYGDGIKTFNGETVYLIDGVPTILRHVSGDYAAGFILLEDLTLKACFVARAGEFYAHGVTLREAMEEAREKYEDNLPEEERIRRFMERYPTLDTIVACRDLFEWHHTLTGSCKMGRTEFVNARGIDVEHDTMSVANFIRLTENAYGGETIQRLKETYDQKTQEQ
jgi:hypothetical protein